jgi:hypothetical protein
MKAVSNFVRSKQTKDGLHTWCTPCRHRGRDHTAESRRYRERHPEKSRARGAVWIQIRRGMPKAKDLSCVDCGKPAQRYDHYKGYEREHWLDVQPVCVRCCSAREQVRKLA